MDTDASEVRCKNPYCNRLIVQVGGGHRRREYCDDACRQTAHRYRVEQAEHERKQAGTRERWTGYLPETQQILEEVMQLHNVELAQRIAGAIDVEREQHSTDQEDYQSGQACLGKLAQAGTRINKLEQQVAIQRQRLGQYYQQLYPSSLAVAEERLLALGAALDYKRLLKYNELTVDIGHGAESWCEFAKSADYDMLALAIQQAQRFYENLEATRSSRQT